jgi:hypothetical protein
METNTAPRIEPPSFGDQIPVDPDNAATLIWFEQTIDNSRCEITRVLATGTLQSTSYQQKTESWYMGSSALTASADVTMTSIETKAVTKVGEFIDGATAVIVADQHEGKSNWAVWTTGDNSSGTLFMAPDPDGLETYIGLYLEFDAASGQLASVAWYRTVMEKAGTVFATTPTSLTFWPVLVSGVASTNPNNMAEGAWSYSKVVPRT